MKRVRSQMRFKTVIRLDSKGIHGPFREPTTQVGYTVLRWMAQLGVISGVVVTTEKQRE